MKTIFKPIIVIVTMALSFSVSAKSFSLPEYETHKFDNGLTVLLLEHKEVPLINVEVRIKAGSIHAEHKGLADVTAEALRLGTQQKNKKTLDDTIDFMGARLGTWSGKDLSGLSASFLKDDQKAMFAIIDEVLTTPSFDESELEKYLKRYASEIQQRKESPRNMIGDYFNHLVFGDHPYAKSSWANETSLPSLTRKNIQSFYQQYYQPQNVIIAVAGDFKAKTMKRLIEKQLGDWKNQQAIAAKRLTDPKPMTESRVLLVNKSDANETTFQIGGLGVSRSNPDYVELSVINTILGGRFTSWLNDELRVNTGLTYGARSSFSTLQQGGTFAISTFTKTSSTKEAIDLALSTYQRLWKKGIDEKTLASAKAYVKGQFPPRYETAGQLADLLADMEALNLDKGFINEFSQRVNGLTVDRTKTLIKKYFPQDDLQFVLIGKAEDIQSIAKKYGKVTQVEIGELL